MDEGLALPIASGSDAPRALADGGVTVRWLGTAGFAVEHAGHVLLIDPYLTRASLGRCVFGRLTPDLAAIGAHAPRAHAIVVGHTHFDHALDVPAIARLTGATVFGSRSAARLCRAAGLPDAQVRDVERSTPVDAEVGPFRLRFVPSAHSRFAFGRVPFPGEIVECDAVPTRMEAYRCGAVFALDVTVGGKRIVHVGSAELADAAPLRAGPPPDLLLLCASGWQSSRDLPERVAPIGARTVLLSHWDDFFRPVERPARALPGVALPTLRDRIVRAAPGVRAGIVPLLATVVVR